MDVWARGVGREGNTCGAGCGGGSAARGGLSDWFVVCIRRRARLGRGEGGEPEAEGKPLSDHGEPTDNRVALASKGALRVVFRATGKMAHSAYPELGESAVHKLVQVLGKLLELKLPATEDVGPSTLNIGQIHGGHAPNVIADKAEAQVLVRLVGDSAPVKAAMLEAAKGLAEVDFTLEIPFARLRAPEGLPTMVAKFTTDIPQLSNWGEPVLLGPGSIHVAHTPFEKLAKRELLEAVELYVKVAKQLLS